jgi:AcrR family transcriptional regulator
VENEVVGKINQSPKLPPETRRKQLLEAARNLFAKEGYELTTTVEIARMAGLTKGAIYHHFESKEDILFELVRSFTERNDAILAEVRGKKLSPGDFLRILMRMREAHEDAHCGELMDIWVQAMRIPRIKRYVDRRFQKVLDIYLKNADLSYVRSQEDLRELGVFILAFHNGLSVLRMHFYSKIDLEAQVDRFEALIESAQTKGRK